MKRVLVVDDFRANVIMIQRALSGKYEVSTATSGKEALQKIKGIKPDLVILDIQMPEMNGIEVLESMITDPIMKDIPVVFLTGQADREKVTKGYQLGIKDIISKPIIMATVETRIDRVFENLENERVKKSNLDKAENIFQFETSNNAFAELFDDNFWLTDDWKDLI